MNTPAILKHRWTKNAFMGAIASHYYSVFTTKKIGGVGKLKFPNGRTQRVVTNWGIDWTGVYKTL